MNKNKNRRKDIDSLIKPKTAKPLIIASLAFLIIIFVATQSLLLDREVSPSAPSNDRNLSNTTQNKKQNHHALTQSLTVEAPDTMEVDNQTDMAITDDVNQDKAILDEIGLIYDSRILDHLDRLEGIIFSHPNDIVVKEALIVFYSVYTQLDQSPPTKEEQEAVKAVFINMVLDDELRISAIGNMAMTLNTQEIEEIYDLSYQLLSTEQKEIFATQHYYAGYLNPEERNSSYHHIQEHLTTPSGSLNNDEIHQHLNAMVNEVDQVHAKKILDANPMEPSTESNLEPLAYAKGLENTLLSHNEADQSETATHHFMAATESQQEAVLTHSTYLTNLINEPSILDYVTAQTRQLQHHLKSGETGEHALTKEVYSLLDLYRSLHRGLNNEPLKKNLFQLVTNELNSCMHEKACQSALNIIARDNLCPGGCATSN